jgi:hypothetical protein
MSSGSVWQGEIVDLALDHPGRPGPEVLERELPFQIADAVRLVGEKDEHRGVLPGAGKLHHGGAVAVEVAQGLPQRCIIPTFPSSIP